MNRSIAATRPLRLGLFGLATLVPLVAIVVFFGSTGSKGTASSAVSHGARNSAAPAKSSADAPPTATEFADVFVGATNQYAKEHGDPARLVRPHCVAAAPGRYMCAYTVAKPGARSTCHLMQARWTPDRASTFTVTLSGRTRKCGSVREAIKSLR